MGEATYPDCIGRFQILGEIGRGAQAVVYRARDTGRNEVVALKVLGSLAGLIDDRARKRFEREFQVASTLRHPNLGPGHEFFEANGALCIVMKFLEGETLAAWIARRRAADNQAASLPGAVDIVKILAIFEKVARALGYAHQHGVLHRDLKPSNIIIDVDDTPYIVDFGLARSHTGQFTTLTQTHDWIGTPVYMSPEQISLSPEELDCRTDVYSLGASLYECLTLERPLQAPDLGALRTRILYDEPRSLRRANPSVSRGLAAVVSRAMAKSRERRHASVLEFADDLARIARGERVHARATPLHARIGRWVLRRPVQLLAALVATLALVVIPALQVQSLRRENESIQIHMDFIRINDLLKRAESLYPPTPDRAMKQRLEELRTALVTMAGRWRVHHQAVQKLRNRALPYSKEERDRDWESDPDQWIFQEIRGNLRRTTNMLEDAQNGMAVKNSNVSSLHEEFRRVASRVGQRRSWSFSDPDIQSLHDHHVAFLAAVAKIGGMHSLLIEKDWTKDRQDPYLRSGALASIQYRIALMDELAEMAASKEVSAAWIAASRRIRLSPIYQGLDLEPIVGLRPLGADLATGLEEFSVESTGTVPPDPTKKHPLLGADVDRVILVLLPKAQYTMGVPEDAIDDRGLESPENNVKLDAFFISKYELTQGQWMGLTGTAPAHYHSKGSTANPHHPVEYVSHQECLEALARVGLTLPTEAQWEYACRAGTTTIWSTGDEARTLVGAARLAGYSGCNGLSAHLPVGCLTPNPWGLYDMIGNVAEWCLDGLGNYETDTRNGDGWRQAYAAPERVIRGGSFADGPEKGRTTYRNGEHPICHLDWVGCRPAMAIPSSRN